LSNHGLLSAAGLALTALTIAGCQTQGPPQAPGGGGGICNRDAANGLTGKDRVTDDQARRITGASLVRQIRPGQGVTMDYRQERVTIETDPGTGKIVRAMCG